MEKSEDNLVAWIASRFPKNDLPIGIGDDMAMVRASGSDLLLTCDMLMDGVDFDTRRHSPEQIGRKSLAVSLSDCAAMAVRPRWALVSVALPNPWSMEMAQQLFSGIEALAAQYDCRIVGGDTNSWDQPLAIDITVIAEPWPGVQPIRRSGMKPDDLLIVTGELGGSLAGHHLDFEPRLREAKWLAEKLGDSLHAMIDLSDGLSTDAHRLAKASQGGIAFSELMVEGVASQAAIPMARQDGRSIMDHVLNDGEDFELLFAVQPDAWMSLKESPEGQKMIDDRVVPRYRVIGHAVKENGVWMDHDDHSKTPIEPRGWQHFK